MTLLDAHPLTTPDFAMTTVCPVPNEDPTDLDELAALLRDASEVELSAVRCILDPQARAEAREQIRADIEARRAAYAPVTPPERPDPVADYAVIAGQFPAAVAGLVALQADLDAKWIALAAPVLDVLRAEASASYEMTHVADMAKAAGLFTDSHDPQGRAMDALFDVIDARALLSLFEKAIHHGGHSDHIDTLTDLAQNGVTT
jgi:hypothetical protein